ncbi:MAG: YggT family protein [Coriobacteriia bacterium]|nr:YggT family protein [Coriobacteriia bacterium]
MSSLTIQLLNVIGVVGQFYVVLLVVYVLMSWFPMNGAFYDVYRVIGSLCEPYIALFRRFIPPMGGIDFSPWAAILVVQFVIVPVLRYLVITVVR